MVQLKNNYSHAFMMHEKLKASVQRSPVLDMGGYPYLVHPVTDGVPVMEPDIIDEIVDWMISVGNFDCDRIVAPEAMGIPLAVALSLRLRIPYTIIRKRPYGADGEIHVRYRTGYSEQSIFVNGLKRGDRVVIVDDMVSTGGTLSAIACALKENGISIQDILVVFSKGSGVETLSEKMGIGIKRMLDVSVADGTVVVTDP